MTDPLAQRMAAINARAAAAPERPAGAKGAPKFAPPQKREGWPEPCNAERSRQWWRIEWRGRSWFVFFPDGATKDDVDAYGFRNGYDGMTAAPMDRPPTSDEAAQLARAA